MENHRQKEHRKSRAADIRIVHIIVNVNNFINSCVCELNRGLGLPEIARHMMGEISVLWGTHFRIHVTPIVWELFILFRLVTTNVYTTELVL